MSGEGNSRIDITVPAAQRQLAEAVAATGKPIVVLLSHGRALALDGAIADAAAILATWFLGCEAGTAIADILFGVTEPTGRLPVSFPRATGQEPWSYDRPSNGRPLLPPPAEQGGRAGWRDAPDTALYPFGHGLGYARFALSDLRLPERVALGATIPITAQIANIGTVAGSHLVQLYIHDVVASVTRPRRLLKAFRRVHLQPGGIATVRMNLTPTDVGFIGPDGRPTIEPGEFRIRIASSSADPGLQGGFTLEA